MNIAPEIIAAVLVALERRRASVRPGELPRPVPALVIARKFGIRVGGSDDSRKRGVRLVVDALRKGGAPILSNFNGYFIGNTPADFIRYQEFRRRSGLSHLSSASAVTRSTALDEARGQRLLFE